MKSTKLNQADKCNYTKFEGKGIYHNTDEYGNEDIILIGSKGIWWNIGHPSEWLGVFDIEKPTAGVSEKLFLKTIKTLSKRR
jgi:hypothetical protein